MKTFTFEESLLTYLNGSFPLIAVNTIEVSRATENVSDFIQKQNTKLSALKHIDDWLQGGGYKILVWDIINGWRQTSPEIKSYPNTTDPQAALSFVRANDSPVGAIYIMENFHLLAKDPYTQPSLIQLMREIHTDGTIKHKHLILIGGNEGLPVEIQNQIVMLDFSYPTKDQLVKFITEYVEEQDGVNIKPKEIQAAAESSIGMTMHEAESALCVALVSSKGKHLDRDTIFSEKAKAVKKSGLLEYVHIKENMNTVGGMDDLKDWIHKIGKVFKDAPAAREYKLPTPKGFIAVGVSGAGKTLCALATSTEFNVPTYRLDVGRVFGSLLGETEANTRLLTALIDALAPCVILIDEVDKAMSGLGSSDSSDAGATARFIGSLLYWMEIKESPAFIVATANDITKLPPEMTRKGRFNEIWFVDAPNAEERMEIFGIHIRKVGREPKKYKLTNLAKASENFTGAEIDNSVHEAMLQAFYEDREFTDKDIHAALSTTIPLIKSCAKQVEKIKIWAKANARAANSHNARGSEAWSGTKKKKRSLKMS